MIKFFVFMASLLLCISTQVSFAQETTIKNETAQVDSTYIEGTQNTAQPLVIEKNPQVGKHVGANMDASSMILSLIMVLAVIFISAIVLKRFNITQQNSSQLKVIANLSLGAKERIIVVQVGEQQLVLGVCPQQISLLKNLEKPLDIQGARPLALSGNVLSFLQRNSTKTSTGNDV